MKQLYWQSHIYGVSSGWLEGDKTSVVLRWLHSEEEGKTGHLVSPGWSPHKEGRTRQEPWDLV